MLGKFQEDNNNLPSEYDLFLGFLQIYDLLLNLNQVSNDILLQELQKQDKEYLSKIVEQNNKIIKLLENKNKDDKV